MAQLFFCLFFIKYLFVCFFVFFLFLKKKNQRRRRLVEAIKPEATLIYNKDLFFNLFIFFFLVCFISLATLIFRSLRLLAQAQA